jgi:cell division protein FtsI/penicillin-binding protein 2
MMTRSVLLLDVRTRRVIAGEGNSNILALPGSTLKPFVLSALLRTRRLSAGEAYVCPGRLRIADRQLNCSHPRLDTPLRPDTALAYSCNCFVAHVAERFKAAELAGELRRFGFGLHGSLRRCMRLDSQQLQALGEDGISTTLAELAMAYLLLSQSAPPPVLLGLEEAVEWGTAQRARVERETVAGKTGSSFSSAGEPVAWFAGFFPSRRAEVVIAVMLHGRSGGADAAPVAGEILKAYRSRRLSR